MKLPELKAKDIFALYMIAIIVVLKMGGIDGGLDAPLALIVGYYFGHRVTGKDGGV